MAGRTLANVLQMARVTDRQIDEYHGRYQRWLNNISTQIKGAIDLIGDCDRLVQLAQAQDQAGAPPDPAILDEIYRILNKALLSAERSARPELSQPLIDELIARIQLLRKPEGYVRPDDTEPTVDLHLADTVPPRRNAQEVRNGGWRPTKKISARKTRTRSKKLKTKTRTRAISKVPIGGYRNRRRMMR
jgi:hypothetical protein